MGSFRTMDQARLVLAEVFGHADFRRRQAQAIESITSGRDTVVVLPTGAGKSVCYQVPAILESRSGGGAAIVVSPLIALMQDQVDALRGHGIAASALHSHHTDFDRREISRAFVRGEIEVLYCSPERAANPSFKRLLADARVSMVAIDEAHCLSQWGHDFRPEYLRLAELVELTGAPTIALTATATGPVIDEIVSRLGLNSPTVVRGDFSRPNLQFDVEHHRGDATRLESLIAALESADLRGPKSGNGRAIVYCSTRKKTESVAKELTSAGFSAAYYHAGRTALARERAKRAFDTGRRRVLVATNAFGMGIDYPDVRLIVHFQTPGSLEAYYQEAGRAGRDGLDARCLLFFGLSDLVTQRRIAQSGSRSGSRDQALAAIEAYARSSRCRQQVICDHFAAIDEAPPCNCCDICRDPRVTEAQVRTVAKTDPVAILRKDDRALISAAVARLRRPVGKGNLALALRGSKAKSLSRGGLLSLPEYGSLNSYNEASVVAAIDELLSRGVLEIRGKKYPKVWLKGRPVREARPQTPSQGDGSSSRSSRSGRSKRRHHTPITKALDNYRKRRARALKWKPYMVFQKKAIVAIEEQRPTSINDLFKIPGLGPAKVERFGEDILALVRDLQ